MRGIKKEKTPYVRIQQDEQENDLMVSNVDLLKQIAESTTKGSELLSQLTGLWKTSKKSESIQLQKPVEYANKKVNLPHKKLKNDVFVIGIAENVSRLTDYMTTDLNNLLLTMTDNIQDILSYLTGVDKSEMNPTEVAPVINITDKRADDKIFKKEEKKEKQSKLDRIGLSKKSVVEDNVTNISANVSRIAEIMSNQPVDKNTKDVTSFTKITRKKDNDNTTSLTKVNRKVGGDSLKNIELYTFKILSNLEKGEGRKAKKEKKVESQEIKITGLAKASKEFDNIGQNIDKKALRGLKTFQRQIEQMAKPRFIKNLKGLNAVLHDFSTKINEIAVQMSSAVISLKEFIRLIGLTAVSLMAPALEKGTKRFVDMFSNVNSKLKETKKATGPGITWKEMLVGLAIGLTAVVGSLLLVKFIDWKDVMKMLGFLAGLFGILSLFNLSRRGIGHRNVVKTVTKTGGTNIKGDNMLTAFAFGLAVLVIGLAAIREIDWKGPMIMLGFITALYTAIIVGNKLSGGVGPSKGMFGTALGVSLLVLAADAANEVFAKKDMQLDIFGYKLYGSSGTLGIITFVLALGLAARISGGGGFRGMLGMAFGVGLLILCADAAGEVFLRTQEKKILGVNWLGTVGTLGLIMFTYAMAGAIRYATGGKNPIGKYTVLYFVGSILAILYAVKRATKLVDKYGFTTVLGGAAVIAGFTWIMSKVLADVNLSMKGINKKNFLEKIGTMSIGILMLAGVTSLVMFTISKIDLSWERVLQFGFMSVLMVGIFVGVNEYINGSKMTPVKVRNTRNTLLNIAGAFVALSVPMMILSYVNVSWKTMTQLGLAIGVLVGISALVGSFDKVIRKGSKTLLLLAGTFTALSISMKILSGVDVSWKTLAQMGASLLGLGLVAAALGIPAVAALVGIGSGVLILLSTSLLLVSLAMKKVSESNVSLKKVEIFAQSLKKLVQYIALITPAAMVAMVGIGPITLVSVAAIAISKSLDAINKLNFDTTKMNTFVESMKSLVKGINKVGIKEAIEAGTKSKQIIKVAETSAKLGDSFKTIQSIQLQENTIPTFTTSITSLVDTFRTINLDGIEEQTKQLLPVISASKDYALALKSLQDITIDETQTQAFCSSLSTFISTFSDELQATVGKMDQMQPGLEALSKIVSLPKQLSEGITSIANMDFIEYENKEGQLVEKNRRKLSETEMTQAATNFGTMLSMLIEPINKLGAAKEGALVTIGQSSFVVASKKEQKKANELIKGIGESYQPIFDITQSVLDKADILADNTKSANIVTNIGNLISSLMTTSNKLKDFPILETEQIARIKTFGEFTSTLKLNTAFDKDLTSYNKNSYNYFDNVAKIMERMESSKISPKSPKLDVINTFADKLNSLKWNTINDGLSKVNKNVEGIVKNINGLKLEKVIKFNDTLKYLSQNRTSENIAECIEKLDELIGTIATYQEKEENYKAAKLKAQEEAKVLQQQIANNSGKSIDGPTLVAILKQLVNDLQGLDVAAEIRNDEGNALAVKVVDNWTSDMPKNKFTR